MTTGIPDVQVQPGSATVRETATVLKQIRDASGRHLAGRGSVNNGHAYDMICEQADQTVEQEPYDTTLYDTTLVVKPILRESKAVEKPRTSITW